MKRFLPFVALAAVLAAMLHRAFSEPVPVDCQHRLRKGMSQAEVRSVLGPPTSIYPNGQWTYQRKFVFGFVNIHWQADGTYDGEFVYERF